MQNSVAPPNDYSAIFTPMVAHKRVNEYCMCNKRTQIICHVTYIACCESGSGLPYTDIPYVCNSTVVIETTQQSHIETILIKKPLSNSHLCFFVWANCGYSMKFNVCDLKVTMNSGIWDPPSSSPTYHHWWAKTESMGHEMHV